MQILISEIKNWIYQASAIIKNEIKKNDLVIATKASRTDLVTNVDKMIQDFLIERIHRFDPAAKILGEENGQDKLTDFSGRVFVIDPIDGTMNFVLEKENFCIMIAVIEDNEEKLGFIYDVMKDVLLWGGPEVGVFKDEERLDSPEDLSLEESLIGMNSSIYRKNLYHLQDIVDRSMGVRMSGCAGVELINLMTGKRNAYISNLAPWDYAAGKVMLEKLGFKVTNIEGGPLKFSHRERVIAATPATFSAIEDCIR